MQDYREKWALIEPEQEPDWVNNENAEPPFTDLDPETAEKEIEKGTMQVIDVRFSWEYRHYHIPGSVLIPLPELEDAYNLIDPDRPVLVVCEHGMRSVDASCFLNLRGMAKEKIFNLETGMAGYSGPVEKD